MAKIEVFQSDKERQILVAMATNRDLLTKLSTIWDKGYRFSSSASDDFASLCVEYGKKYNKAPRSNIQGLIRAWAESQQDKEALRQMERIAESLSDDAEKTPKINVDFYYDLAVKHLTEVKLEKSIEQTKALLEMGKLEDAIKCYQDFNRPGADIEEGTYLFTDETEVASLFDTEESEVLFTYPGDMGKFFGSMFARDSFVSFVGPEKSGKTHWLVDCAYRALRSRCKVAFFEVGDMSRRQIEWRFMVRNARHPKFADKKIPYPTALTKGNVKHEIKSFPKNLNKDLAWAACQKLMNTVVRSKDSHFYLSVHPAATINVRGIKAILARLAKDGFVPDVCVIDYADILAPMDNRRADKRDQINDTWTALRALSLETHSCVITASQCNRGGYKAKLLSIEHNSDDKRKAAHVTAMVGINVTPEEAELSLGRLNVMAIREGRKSKPVHYASCLPLCNPCVLSSW